VQRVLVVDDVPEVRRRIAGALEGLHADVLQAADGAEALATLETGPVGVVVSDVRMPRMDGLGLLRALRHAEIPVILHSGYADVPAAVEALRLGAVDFLTAPLDYERLRARVDHCLRRLDATRCQLVGSSRELEAIRLTIARIADASEPVLITGETGVGKEVVARAIHAASGRREKPFVAVNLCALPDGTLESELFGHERGAFTGAAGQRRGRFEQADGGTILLDEIGDAPPRIQAELLRVVETRSFERVGGTRPIRVDARILAATHRQLPVEVAQGRFREDLWYRLSAFRIHVPPLRERRTDIDALLRAELDHLSAERGAIPFEIDAEASRRLHAHAWSGNARELLLTVRRMAILAGERRLLDAGDAERALRLEEAPDVAPTEAPLDAADTGPGSRREFLEAERRRILDVLNTQRWNVSASARALGLTRSTLRVRMRRLGLD
jgi:DNA-binding NtrC family response regulator